MRLIELRLKNLNSLKGEWHIDFADTAFTNEGIFAITGQTGAGKTTILDAICLALYGETPRINSISKSSNEVMTRQTAECFAEVVIDLNGEQYRCRWGQRRAYNKADGNLQDATHEIAKINVDDSSKGDELLESTLKHTKNKIIELTRMDFQQFTRSILLAQGSFSAFLKAKADERADILEKITGTDIYATISTQVHDKKRTEEEILNKLQYGLDGLMLLNTDEESQLKVDLQSYQSAQSEQQQTIQDLAEKIKWLDSVTESKEKLNTYQNDLAQAQQAQQDFIPSAKRLIAANKALEIDSQFGELSSTRKHVNELSREKAQLEYDLPKQQALTKSARTQLETAKNHTQAAHEALQTALPNIAQARKLDVEIAQNKNVLKDIEQRQQTLMSSTQHLSKEIDNHKQQAAQNKIQLTRVEGYLNDAHELNTIDSDIANFKSHCGRLKALLQENTALSDDKTSQQQQIHQYRAKLDVLNQQKKTKDTTMLSIQDKLAALQQEQAALTQVQSLADMRDEQEQIDDINRQLDQVSVKAKQQDELSVQVEKIVATLPVMSNDLTKLAGLIADNESAISAAKEKRQDKQAQLHLLQKVAKLEDYIADLKDGHPCPLCGSLEHPYSADHPHLIQETEATQTQRQIAELDTTISNLEDTLSKHRINQATVRQQFAQAEEQQTLLNHQIQKLKTDIDQLVSSLLNKGYSQFVAETLKPLMQIETHVDALSLLDSSKIELGKRRESLKNTLTQYETLSESLSTMRNDIEALDKEQRELTSTINDIESNSEKIAWAIENLDKKSADNFSELTVLKTDILAPLNKYSADKHQSGTKTAIRSSLQSLQPLITSIENQTVLSNFDAQAHINTLRQCHSALLEVKQQFNDYREDQQNLKTSLGRLETQIETKQSQLDKEENELVKLVQLVAERTEAIEKLQTDRKYVFANKDPETEEKRLRDALDQAQISQTSAQRQLDNAEHILSQLLDKQRQVTEQVTTVRIALSSQEDTFKSALAASDFSDEIDFTNARLPIDERNALRQQQQHIDYALKQAQSLLDATQKAIEAKQANPLTTDDRETLTQQQSQAQDEFNKRIESIGAISQRLKDNEDKKITQQAQIDAITAQKDKLQVWQQLHKLIGSSDGKKFRTFAQGLTFDLMVTHANTQLQKMSDRYLLARDDNSPLELNVIDNYQGGEIRSTKNLSGGEGFIISLALALGLSQMASQNIRVDSLFLDEGFGTLDEESLDIALDTLTNLQQEGKLIGVISHVQALKDRILTQIKVEKLSGGFSRISGQGCHKVVSEKVS
ncbi:SbcC/MukB-like Walker B domain-containing protein [Psychrobacter sp. Ps2]|uniref:AAA family ATPase n=1 Tax=Psychrobacter sp. Ps2 TaxID=2790956 RepID=UPI001EE03974|nr:SbcC/MukB-like Walker B domain-containing protein [Psychrobacter sp. Ps2]MCG3859425.1 AAA family ATPase [Psychrobacter sp. Ps2]